MVNRGLIFAGVWVVVAAGCSCGPGDVLPDAGVSDGGRVDAGHLDAGQVDGGAGDGGGTDSGNPDAGLADAGPLDAGVGDGGPGDAGPLDAGVPSPETCNGVDDDLDGLVDDEADGGLLARLCPLTLGVCARARSFCVDGGWAACDYGPDYERTERRCDGLDNDCDGTVDSSWTRTVLDADAGRFGPLMQVDLLIPLVVPETSGHWLALTSDLLVVDDDLVVTSRIGFPRSMGGISFLFPDGNDWVRIAQYNLFSLDAPGLFAHRVFADGGSPLGADGGIEMLAQVPWPTGCGATHMRAARTDGGWVAVVGTDARRTDCAFGEVVYLALDGGLTVTLLDAGVPLAYGDWTGVHVDGDQFTLFRNQETWRLDLGGGALAPSITMPPGCFLSTVSPVTSECWWSTSMWMDPVTTRDVAPVPWWPVREPASPGRAVGIAPPPDWDGGVSWPSTRLGEARDGGVLELLTLEGIPASRRVSVQPISGRLHLVLYGDDEYQGICPLCAYRRLAARYVCLPP